MKRFILAIVLSAAAFNVNAATYLFDIGGTIDVIRPWATSIELGDLWSASMRVDSTAVNTSPHSYISWYLGLEGTISFGAYTMSTENELTNPWGGHQISITNDPPTGTPTTDSVSFDFTVGETYPQVDGYDLIEARIYMGDPTASVFNSIVLDEVESTSFSDFQSPEFTRFALTFLNSSGGFEYIEGTVENYSMSTVPAPAAFWLFGSALGLLGWMRRKTA